MKLHFHNISPLYKQHADYVVEDIAQLCQTGDFDETAFNFTLVPEGDPAYDKAKIYGEAFEIYREKLKARGLQAGMLIQATMGHGWMPESRSSFQKFRAENMEYRYIHCPLDQDFRKYIYDSIHYLATLKPDFFMIDDDFRMFTGRGGCFCPLHLEYFASKVGKLFTAEELRDAIKHDDVLYRKFVEVETQSLNELAAIIRKAIDDVDPSIPCSFCACAGKGDLDQAHLIAKTLAAKNQQYSIIRINNGRYLRNNPAEIPAWLHSTCKQRLALPLDTEVLTEADTCPQNRYSTDSACMHANITLSLLNGYAGAKLWITRLADFQPNSGKDYRRILKKHIGLYQAIRDAQPKWQGFNSPIRCQQPYHGYEQTFAWGKDVLSSFGIPFRYNFADNGPTSLTDCEVAFLSDDEIKTLLAGKAILDGNAAKALVARGFAQFLGFESIGTPEQKVSKEVYIDKRGEEHIMTGSPRAYTFTNPNPKATVLSTFFHKSWACAEESAQLGPGCIKFENELGGTVVTFGAYIDSYDLGAFFLLNEARKLQLKEILQDFQELPICYDGDARVMCQFGDSNLGKMFYFCNTSNDILDDIPIDGTLAKQAAFKQLMPDGSLHSVKVDIVDGQAVLPVQLIPLHPVVFVID